MALDKLVDSAQLDAGLGSVADAIRAKGGTSAQLPFPAGFVSAIGELPAGGAYDIDELIDGSITSIVSDAAVIKVNAFSGCTHMTAASLPEAARMGSGGTGVFGGCEALVSLSMPKMAGSVGVSAFNGCKALPAADLAAGVTQILQQAFTSCYALEALVLRRTAGIVTIANTSVFNNTPLTGRGGTYSGHVYVPAALLNSYRTASNWSALYANYPGIFETIEGSVYE